MGCPESLAVLKQIEERLKQIYDSLQKMPDGFQEDWLRFKIENVGEAMVSTQLNDMTRSITDNRGIWEHEQKGKSHFYTHQKTTASASETYNLDFPVAQQLNHIWIAWNNATSKSYDIRIYNDPSVAYYVSLNKKKGDTNTSMFQQGGAEFKFQAGARISIVTTSVTPGQIIRVVIQADEI